MADKNTKADDKTSSDTTDDGDPWESTTPDMLMDGIADRLWKKMGATPDGEDDTAADDTTTTDSGEQPPKATSRGQKLSDWFFSGVR